MLQVLRENQLLDAVDFRSILAAPDPTDPNMESLQPRRYARKPVSVVVDRSKAEGKKLRATFTYSDGSRKTTNFGGAGYEDFTIHKDKVRKQRYLDRHNKRENWNDPTTAGALSRWLLWNEESLSKSFDDYVNRFDLEGNLKVKRSGGP